MNKTEMIKYNESKWYRRFFDKIRNFFNRKKASKEEAISYETEVKSKYFNKFTETMQNNFKITEMQRKFKAGEIKIVDLTIEDLKEIIELYKVQIEAKEQKLLNYRDKMVLSKKGE